MAKTNTAGSRASAFAEQGLAKTIQALSDEVRELYLGDAVPWVVGYSGGKDSSAILQLVWLAIRDLPAEKRTKPIHVITTDTLVEQPLVAAWVDTSQARMREAAAAQGLPITPHKLTPEIEDSFWVNLIGKGYPAPRQKFRWCTERLKIRPSNKFIRSVVQQNGEAILVLGTRKAESQKRAATMTKHEARRVRERLSPNVSLPNSLVYTPIEDWSNDDVWLYLMQVKNPWSHDNKTLLGMYQGASEGGECPLVVDTTTPSCGTSRFGCWVCTVVDKDRSMEAMIKNDEEKVWMTPLLELRNELDRPDDRDRRDFRRMSGRVQLMADGAVVVPGPYKKEWREHWLRRVLEAQQSARQEGPPEFRNLQLIAPEELHEIRRIWLYEKHEFDDSLPRIFEEATGTKFAKQGDEGNALRADDWEVLREVCGDDPIFFDLQVALLGVERQFRGMARRAGIYEDLEERLRIGLYSTEQEAVAILGDRDRKREQGKKDESFRKGLTVVDAPAPSAQDGA
ncbi:MAG: DNA phosphorothioation system sulfurtransferase DndC [Gemmataceae bacterium]|nr:DNA phosphorothioation system sulfurtransferase DndC [Gemmataceae bacterium]